MSAKKTRRAPRHGLVILGMHGSGSSALAGVLAKLGCDLPRDPGASDGSDPSPIRDLNDAILSSGGSSWDDWQPFDPDWISSPPAAGFMDRGGDVLEREYDGSGPLVVEDPRICRLVPFWRRVFKAQGIRPFHVHEHRPPMAVAAALEAREGWPFGYGLLLWLRHVLDAEIGTRGRNRLFTSHERVVNDWAGVVDAMEARSRIVFPHRSESVGGEIDAFLNADSRRVAEPDEGMASGSLVSKWIDVTFDTLESWARGGENPADYKALDKVRTQFDRTAPLFGSLIETMRTATTDLTRVETERDRMAAILEDAQGAGTGALRLARDELDILRRERKDPAPASAPALADLEVRVADLQAERIAEAQARKEAERDNETLRREAKQLADEKWQIQSELAQRKMEIEETGRQNGEDRDRVASLTAEVERLSGLRDEELRAARLERVRMQKDFQERMTDVVTGHRKRSDEDLARARTELKGLHEAVAAATEAARAGKRDREALALDLSRHKERLAELEEGNRVILASTSWKITAPIRGLLTILRR